MTIVSPYRKLFKLMMPIIAESFIAENGGGGSENKTLFVAAVSMNEEGHPILMNFTVVKGFRSSEISQWSKKHLSAGSVVVSDGLACFKAVEEAQCQHFSIITGGGPESVKKEQFIWVNTMIGNVKNSIEGLIM